MLPEDGQWMEVDEWQALGLGLPEETLGAGEVAQQLRSLTALPKALCSNPSNHTVAHNHL